MATKFGISTQEHWNSPLMWPGQWHEITDVRFSSRYGGGPQTLTFRVVVPTGAKPRGIKVGYKIRVWQGMENIWTGRISQPDTGGDGIGVSADGLGSLATDFVCTEHNNALFIEDNVDAAIARGLPWRRIGTAPGHFGVMNPGTTLKDALDEITKQSGVQWSVSATGNLTWPTDPVNCQFILWAWGQGGVRTTDNFGTDFYANYNPVEDYVIDTFEGDNAALAQQTGTIWVASTDVHYEGSGCIYTLGAAKGHRNFQNAYGAPVNLAGYQRLSWRASTALAGPVERNYTITLESGSATWTSPNILAEIAPNTWARSWMVISDPPAGFDAHNVTGYSFQTDGGIYLDAMTAESPFTKNAWGVFNPPITPAQSNVAARNRYDRKEINVDLSGQGGIATSDAIQVAQKALSVYGYRVRWTQSFVATKNSLTTMRGTPVALASVQPGWRVRVLLADLNEPETGVTGDAIEIIVGETDYEEATNTLTLTPVDAQRKELIDLLGKLPTGRQS